MLYLVLTLVAIVTMVSSLMGASPKLVSSAKIVFKTERVVF